MRVVIRADASSAIGTGHLMRTLALAQALRDGGDDVTLVTSAESAALLARWEREGAVVRRINTEPGSTQDAGLTSEIARQADAEWLVVDGYGFGRAYQSALNHGARLLLVDDHGGKGMAAALVVNGNLYARDVMYPSIEGRLLAGPQYSMLRREFRAPVRAPHHGPIVLSLGGADPDQRTAPILEALTVRGMRGAVVIGPSHRAPERLHALAIDLGWEPLDAPEEMATVLAGAELAIVGAGTTTLECAAMGVPMVAVRIAENQALVAAALAELGLAVVADGTDPEGVAEASARLVADAARRMAMAAAGPSLVDGRGALRVASAMREAMLTIRGATRADAGLLYDWRNDPETRAASFATGDLEMAAHVAWLDRALTSVDTRVLVCELDGIPVGVVRFEIEGAAATISATVAPTARSRGLAAPMIRAAMNAVSNDLHVDRVDAYIRPDNVRSRRAFAAAGFVEAPRASSDPAHPEAVLMVAPPDRRR